MSNHAICVRDLGKRYRIGGAQRSYKTLRESLTRAATAPLSLLRRDRKSTSGGRKKDNFLWALKDISFDVTHGDVVGIIGGNGAGKSTLLKILSRITSPTEGYADVSGRVGALLEVGTGFHPELTGRENIYLNGAILGMGRTEIDRKFDEIVDFSGVEQFLDTPVKHYSSGMYLRLAFAVAAHMEPDILLVDEVLAVGDITFQKKCLGRMETVANEGRTVLFISHNMGAVRSLCNKGIYLENGQVEVAGDLGECIHRYFHSIGAFDSDDEGERDESQKSGFDRVRLGGAGISVDNSQTLEVSTTFHLKEPTAGFYLYCIMEDMHGTSIFHLKESSTDLGIDTAAAGSYQIQLELPVLWLNPGMYALHFKAIPWGVAGFRYTSDKFPVDVQGDSSSLSNQHTILHPSARWEICRASETKLVATKS